MVIRGQLFHYRWTSRWPIKSGDLKIHIGTKMLKTFMKTPEKAFTYLLDKAVAEFNYLDSEKDLHFDNVL